MFPRKNAPRISNNAVLNEVKSFRFPVYRKTKDCDYVEYYAYNPEVGKLCRKRIKINVVKGTRARRDYANQLIDRISKKLLEGWNPFIYDANPSNMLLFSDCLDKFDAYNEHMFSHGGYRKQTYDGYKSYNHIFREFSKMRGHEITYLYQMDFRYLTSFLDEIFIYRNNSARTRNNYLTYIRVLCNFFKDRGWIEYSPADNIHNISSRLIKKERELIPVGVIKQISVYCKEHDPWFLLACYLLYYCFIRPQELCRLRISNINFDAHTIFFRCDQSKNKQSQSVTMPKVVRDYLDLLEVRSYPDDFYLFSKNLLPGIKEMNPVIFRHHWEPVRDALGFPSSYKFYSLKDTGITELAYNNVTSISIRDQARHSSLAITDIYTRHANSRANSELDDYRGSL